MYILYLFKYKYICLAQSFYGVYINFFLSSRPEIIFSFFFFYFLFENVGFSKTHVAENLKQK